MKLFMNGKSLFLGHGFILDASELGEVGVASRGCFVCDVFFFALGRILLKLLYLLKLSSVTRMV